jgi:hypothetical protein
MRYEGAWGNDPRTHVIQALTARDPALAYRWIQENFGLYEQPKYACRLGERLASDPLKWLPGLMEAIPDKKRTEFLKSVLTGVSREMNATQLLSLNEQPPTSEWKLVINSYAENFVIQHSAAESASLLANATGSVRRALALALAAEGKVESVEQVTTALRESTNKLNEYEMEKIFLQSPEIGRNILLEFQDERVWERSMAAWATHDPAQSLTWMTALDEAKQTKLVAGLVQGWCESDEYAASEWTASLPDGPVRHHAAAALAWKIAEPADAWAWLMSVPYWLNLEQAAAILGKWKAQNPAAAEAAIQASSCSEKAKQELMEISPISQ